MGFIRFRRLTPPRADGPWPLWTGIARDELTLLYKLDGGMAEVWMPAKPWWVRWWRKVFPLRGINLPADGIEREYNLR